MVLNKLVTRAVFGIIGNVISFGLFASQAPTFYRVIKKNNSVEELKPEYYLLTTMNCFLWMLYGMPFIHPGNILVLTANGIGLVINLAYLIILLYTTDNKQRMYVGGAFLIELVVVGLVSGLVIGLAHTILARTAIVGGFCFIFGLVMYVPRISGWFTICRTRSVEGDMPFPLLVTNTLNDLCWLIYASIRFDCILWFTYCCGVLVGVVQLVLHRIYRKCIKVSCEYNKLAEVPLQGIDIGDDVHSKLAVEEVRLQKTETYDDKKLATTEVQLQEIVAL